MTTQKDKIVVERALRASAARVWAMWTTKEGLESWWGPVGFSSVVRRLDVRVGGAFEIVMTATLPEIIRHLTSLGVSTSNVTRGDYLDVVEYRRLAYANAVDFVPGVAPYATNTVVDFATHEGGTRLTVTTDAMHDEHWTRMAAQGFEQQLGKLEEALA